MPRRLKISAYLALLLLTAVWPTVALGAEAAIEGRVPLPKTRVAPVVTQRYEIVSKGGVVATNPPLGVVYLEGAGGPASGQVKQIVQKDLAFNPPLLVIQTGTRVEFPNHDETFHNIFSFSPTKRFDLGRYRPEERPIPSQVFDKPGLVILRCDIHEHMRALILVVDTPYFTTTDPEGNYRLPGVPTGKFQLKAWTNSKETAEKTVELKAGATSRVDFP